MKKILPGEDQLIVVSGDSSITADHKLMPNSSNLLLCIILIFWSRVKATKDLIKEACQGNDEVMDIDTMWIDTGNIVKEIVPHKISDTILDDPSAFIFGEYFSSVQAREGGGKTS